MAFTDMNDVEHELGEEKPPNGNGNRNFLIIAGVLGGIMVLALLCIAALALFKYLPGQQSAQDANATNEAQATTVILSASQTAFVPTSTATSRPTVVPTNTKAPTNTPVIVLGPTKTPTLDIAVATRNALLTAVVQTSGPTTQPTSQLTSQPTKTALPVTGFADELGIPGLIAAAFVLVVIIFLMRRLRTTS
jgi:type II secretory pathway pseudopilin PulG